jgi:hypothetical protein
LELTDYKPVTGATVASGFNQFTLHIRRRLSPSLRRARGCPLPWPGDLT